jgi:hypothetical protein
MSMEFLNLPRSVECGSWVAVTTFDRLWGKIQVLSAAIYLSLDYKMKLRPLRTILPRIFQFARTNFTEILTNI